jgi:hypothetical protein
VFNSDSGARENLVRVSPSNPCPICEHPDWCGICPDGHCVVCMRNDNGKPSKNGGWVHRLTAHVPSPPVPKKVNATPKDWPAEARRFAANLDADRKRKLAALLKLPTAALDVLPLLGFNPDDAGGPCFTFPEVDQHDTPIGLGHRFRDGGKMAMAGSKRGLTLPVGWRDRPGVLFVVEGPTDVCAMTHAGLACVGRPGAQTGVELLTALLRDVTRAVIVVAENDKKPNGSWPGRDGAVVVARRLTELLKRPVRWALVPDGAKDPREWLVTRAAGESADWHQFGRDLSTALTAVAESVTPTVEKPAEPNCGDSRDAPAGWGAPAPLPEMPPAPPFPLDAFPAKVGDYWQAAAESLHVPVDYVAVPALPLLGAAIGRSRAASVKRTDSEPALLWCVLVAPPGRAKSPSLQLAKGPLSTHTQHWRELHREKVTAFESALAAYDVEFAKWKKSPTGDPPRRPDKPALRQLVLDKFTTESLVRINADDPRGLVLAQDELSGLVTGLGQYKARGGDDKQTLLSLWAGAECEVNRVKDKDSFSASPDPGAVERRPIW